MATFYALPGLVTWAQVGGWSATSGGPSNGISTPGNSDDVIFDANSGVARVIAGPGDCKSITAVASAAITLSGTLSLTSFSAFINAPSLVSIGGVSVKAGNTTFTGSCTIAGTLEMGTSAATVTLDASISADKVQFVGLSGNKTVVLRSHTLSLTGTGALWDAPSGGSTPVVVAADTSTIKVTDISAADKTFSGRGLTYSTLWHAGGGALIIGDNNTFSEVKASPGTTLKFASNQAIKTINADGSLGRINLLSTSTTRTLTNPAPGNAPSVVTACNLQNLAASPAGAFPAKDCTNLGGATGWAFSASKFMAFF